MKKINIKERYIKILFIVFIFILCFSWAISQPYDSAPDEYMKYDICKYIVQNGKLPHGGDETIRNPIWGISYGFQPILSYIIGALFMKIVMTFTGFEVTAFQIVVSARMVSVLCNVGTTVFVMKIGEKLFDNKFTKWMFIVFVTLLPQFVFLGTYINNDSLAIFSISIIIYAWLEGIKNNWNKKSIITLAIGIGICAISYYNAYVFILSSILLFIASFYKDKKYDLINLLKKGICVSIIVILICGWYFIRNAIIYEGDFLGLSTETKYAEEFAQNEYKPSNLQTPQRQGYSIIGMLFSMGWIKYTFKSFIALFGYMSLFPPMYLYTFFEIVFAICILGLFLCVKKILFNENKEKRMIHYFFIFSMVLTLGLSVFYSYASDYQPQGRYIMPALIPFMYFMVMGIEKIIDFIKRDNIKNIIKIIISLIWAVTPLICLICTIIPFYSKGL